MPGAADMKIVKRRIKSVTGISQITRAMEMVATNKLRKAQLRIEKHRLYAAKMEEMLQNLALAGGGSMHPLMEVRPEIKTVCLLVVTADKGLCGSFNTNAIRSAEKYMKAHPGLKFKLVCVGRKGFQYFNRRGYEIAGNWTFIDQDLPTALLQQMNDLMGGLFLSGEVDQVVAVFNRFESIVRQAPVVTQFLPVAPPEEQGEGPVREVDFIFEPDPARIYQELIPSYSRTMLFDYLADSIASEHGARMNAMHMATDAALDMIKSLTLRFNKARQASITTELMDIVGGAEALVEG